MYKFSIIIPVYNAEKYLGKCLDSLCLKEYSDVEVILINDGSIDNTSKICLDFRSKYPDNIHYISKVNNGVSAARNDGIKVAKGEYIVFIDADDFVSLDFIDNLHEIISENADLFVYQYNVVNEDDDVVEKKCSNKHFMQLDSNGCENIFELIEYQPWNKCFRADVIHEKHLFFDESMKWSEDIDFIARYCSYINSIYITDKVMYNYRVNSNGAVASMDERAIECHHKAFKNQIKLLDIKKANESAYINLSKMYVEHMGLTINECSKKGISISKIKDSLRKSHVKEDLVYKPNSLSSKYKYLCIKNEWISLLLLYFKIRNA